MEKKLLITGSVFMLVAVVLGAMAAHALENYLTDDQLRSFETGVRYQVYHGLALMIFSQVKILSNSSKNVLWILFTAGTVLFSWSIFLLSTGSIYGIDARFLGPITPIGGLLLISGWIYGIVKVSLYKL
ncbi:Uncharacterized membrane protein YgdD, TMEM256/DUF423 family [Nonlabens sp. Hel1_33_55]|uniref:DUF423 domain-containing protein n=1 Tax=Nonlabens sp. Hel1_33_55 TaxID=1336802 RepID=UPI000875B438|nr:DUF423 domain-containing protein [Nonlabens sp. Hel1_33_55]SCY39769.1 Uncharacterized membrane protein YgdD, TMEM256/DUF423 family [Nonlabens sp. Hel1_33_55]